MAAFFKDSLSYDMSKPPEQIKAEIDELESNLLSEGALDYKFSDEDISNSPIRNYYKGKTILLTGGTGFLGQLLMEKLLRCEVKHIYLLTRKKHNKNSKQRLDEIFSEIQFCRLKLLYPNFREHVSITEGNMSLDAVGIKDTDVALLQNSVEIILHAAADVRFNNRIYDLVITNLRGTRELLRMAEHCKKLQIFHYISTAYSNCSQGKCIREKFYEPPMDPDVMIAYAEQITNNALEQEHLEFVTDRLIGKSPNTYTFSKCLSEELIRRSGSKFPVCVSRPSIVISTNREPLPGWINNIYGLTGIITAVALGLCRLLLLNPYRKINVICADFVINGILASTWSRDLDIKAQKAAKGSHFVPEPLVYNIVDKQQITGDECFSATAKIYEQYPLKRIVWVVCRNTTNSKILFTYLSWYYHMLTSMIIDTSLWLMRRKDRVLPYARKVQVFTKALSYFMQNEWEFETTNLTQVHNRMHPVDRKLFVCDTNLFSYEKWSYTYTQGAKRFIGNDDLKNVLEGRKRYRRMKMLQFMVRMLFYASQLLILYTLAKVMGFTAMWRTADEVVACKANLET